jgi:hypothetical protein
VPDSYTERQELLNHSGRCRLLIDGLERLLNEARAADNLSDAADLLALLEKWRLQGPAAIDGTTDKRCGPATHPRSALIEVHRFRMT